MSNLNDFVNTNPTRHIRSTVVNNGYGTGAAGYDDAKQTLVLHTDTRLIKIRNLSNSTDLEMLYSLDGVVPPVGVLYDNSTAPTHTPAKYINVNTENQTSTPAVLKVSGGETFKYNRCSPGGAATVNDGVIFLLEEYGY